MYIFSKLREVKLDIQEARLRTSKNARGDSKSNLNMGAVHFPFESVPQWRDQLTLSPQHYCYHLLLNPISNSIQ